MYNKFPYSYAMYVVMHLKLLYTQTQLQTPFFYHPQILNSTKLHYSLPAGLVQLVYDSLNLQLLKQAKSELLASLKVDFREFCAKSKGISDLQDVRPITG